MNMRCARNKYETIGGLRMPGERICLHCDKLTQARQGDSTVKAVCSLTMEPKWLVDGCQSWSKKIEVYEARDVGESAIDVKI
jgi:hypothetical protein